jgi:hypothetical protein
MEARVIQKLKEKYPSIHSVMFLRSMEKARTPGDLFDILDTFPKAYPVEWDYSARRWKTCQRKGDA